MKLFEIGPSYELEINKPWILMIPEFATIIRKDKGSEGDYRGDKKLMSKRKLAFIFMMADFRSPFRDWKEEDKREEAMRCTRLQESDIDEDVIAALHQYERMLEYASRSLVTLRAVEKSLSALDSYFETVDFNERDKKGEQVHDPKKLIDNIKTLGPMYDSVEKFRKRVEEDLAEDSGIRGQAERGDKEVAPVGTTQNYTGNMGKVKAATSWDKASDTIKSLERIKDTVRNPISLDGEEEDV